MGDKDKPREPRWEVKVTSKGQITLPKEARDAMMVREGDHLEAEMQGDTIVLRRRDMISEAQRMRAYAARNLRSMGVDPEKPCDALTAPRVRSRMPVLSIDMTERIRAERERSKREE